MYQSRILFGQIFFDEDYNDVPDGPYITIDGEAFKIENDGFSVVIIVEAPTIHEFLSKCKRVNEFVEKNGWRY